MLSPPVPWDDGVGRKGPKLPHSASQAAHFLKMMAKSFIFRQSDLQGRSFFLSVESGSSGVGMQWCRPDVVPTEGYAKDYSVPDRDHANPKG